MGQQFPDPGGRLRGQAREYVLQISIRIVAIEFGRLDQGHDSRRTLSRTQRTGEQPIVAANGDGPNLWLDLVVIGKRTPSTVLRYS